MTFKHIRHLQYYHHSNHYPNTHNMFNKTIQTIIKLLLTGLYEEGFIRIREKIKVRSRFHIGFDITYITIAAIKLRRNPISCTSVI